jgi:antitoxin (DNA-binding transcriptional repressor) of toxin-antitoxin stability system
MRLGLREANQHFSRAIRAVKGGREVVLTERGKAVAIIRPLPEPDPTERTVRQLEAAGLLKAAEIREPLRPWRPRRIRGKGLSETVREERDAD